MKVTAVFVLLIDNRRIIVLLLVHCARILFHILCLLIPGPRLSMLIFGSTKIVFLASCNKLFLPDLPLFHVLLPNEVPFLSLLPSCKLRPVILLLVRNWVPIHAPLPLRGLHDSFPFDNYLVGADV